MINVGQWIETHKQEAGLGAAAAAVVVLAMFHKRQAANSAATAGAVTETSGQVATGGGIGLPSTTTADVQNAVQGQINDNINALRTQLGQQIADQHGPTGATGKAGTPGKAGAPGKAAPSAPTMYEINLQRLRDHQGLLTAASYKALYPGGRVQNTSESKNVAQHVTAAAAVAANNAKRTRLEAEKAAMAKRVAAAAPKPKPKPVPHKAAVTKR